MVRLSQTESGRNELTERVYKALDTVGILSLSKREANMLMWSYYAEGHKGVAIRFNMAPEHLLVIPARFMPVELKYCTQFPRINYFNSTLPDFVLGILGTKAVDWEHEAEWRLVVVNRTGHVRLPPAIIDGVILGLRIAKDDEDAVRSWVKARPVKTAILRIRHKPGSFELEAVSA